MVRVVDGAGGATVEEQKQRVMGRHRRKQRRSRRNSMRSASRNGKDSYNVGEMDTGAVMLVVDLAKAF